MAKQTINTVQVALNTAANNDLSILSQYLNKEALMSIEGTRGAYKATITSIGHDFVQLTNIANYDIDYVGFVEHFGSRHVTEVVSRGVIFPDRTLKRSRIEDLSLLSDIEKNIIRDKNAR